MQQCYQTPTQSVWEHGKAVHQKYRELMTILGGTASPSGWRLPDWLFTHREAFRARLLDPAIPATYQVWHDCGKPFCLVVDEDGKRHFPNHARVSEQTWLAAGGAPAVGALIAMDMDFHLCSAEDVTELAKRPQAASLFLTALAEIHANADLFGGVESTSFKTKFKHLDRRGKALLRCWQVT